MGTAGWIILGIIVVVGLWLVADLQRPRHAAAALPAGLLRHRRAAQAAPRPGAEPGRDREGLRGAREGHARGRDQGAQRGGDRAGPGRAGRRRGRAAGRAAPALRAGRGLSRPQGQPELPAAAGRTRPTSRTRSPPRAASSTMRLPSTTPRARASRPCCSRTRMGFAPQEFFNLDEGERTAVQHRAAGEVLTVIPGLRRDPDRALGASDRWIRDGAGYGMFQPTDFTAHPGQPHPLGDAAGRIRACCCRRCCSRCCCSGSAFLGGTFEEIVRRRGGAVLADVAAGDDRRARLVRDRLLRAPDADRHGDRRQERDARPRRPSSTTRWRTCASRAACRCRRCRSSSRRRSTPTPSGCARASTWSR